MKLFSIVPVYNVEPYITEFLESLIKQDFNNIEFILVDDGSTDNSGKICDEYSIKDKRIKVFHIPNGGVSHARNYGLELVKKKSDVNDYILFFDPDDYLTHPEAIFQIASEITKTYPNLLLYNNNQNNTLSISNIRRGG